MPLSKRKVDSLREPGRYKDGDGLFLQITKTGIKSWVFRYERDGVERMIGLGRVGLFSVDEVREQVRTFRQQLFQKKDPLYEREKARRGDAKLDELRLEQVAENYHAAHQTKWRNAKYRKNYLDSLRNHAFGKLGTLPVSQIGTPEILDVLEPLWKKRPHTANRVRGRLKNILDWAKVRGLRGGDNPAKWDGHLQHILPVPRQGEKKHHSALPYVDMPAFYGELSRRPGVGSVSLRFTILTACRTNEIIGAAWDEVAGAVWTIPGNRMKAGKEHIVPLSEQAVHVLSMLSGQSPWLFPNDLDPGKHISPGAMPSLLRRMHRDDITVHGMRSAFRTWAAECTDFPREVCEVALAHAVGTALEQAYARGTLFEKRRQLMDAWSGYCAGT